jgi:tRNA/rRNA methyltransferase
MISKQPYDRISIELLNNVALVLVRPKHPENIGAAARIGLNMGISRLLVVGTEPPDRTKMLKVATHEAAPLINRIAYYTDLSQALAPFACIVGTTARLGRRRRVEITPRQLADTLLPLLRQNQAALLFGPEDRGLTNNDLQYCQLTVTIPTAGFSSLNLAQAVAIICYELFCGTTFRPEGLPYKPKLATTFELEEMYNHIERLLNTIGLLKTEDSTYWLRNIRHFLGRTHLRAKEARIIHAFCRQLLWYDQQSKSNRLKRS